MKKIMMMGLVLMLLMVPSAVFAEEVETEEWKDFRLEQVEEYTPENYDEWSRLFESKDTLSAERETLKADLADLVENVWKPYIEGLRGDAKELMTAYKEALKAQVEAGEITIEESKELFETYKTEVYADLILMKEENEAEKAERQEDKIYFDNLRAERKALNENIKSAIEAEDFDSVPGYLNSILSINQELEIHHIDVNDNIQNTINELNDL
ncbi:hypothetical protein EZV73_05590 [Acidaminobacter sp. JC074]|uniref:hypothetical protein n=1 Tax=Acidaminobacter sp. JC074 TaxID=2530199 RepID=UPI001F109961|nr:hypothetical protein [Acidaminobacter sp. JC074]MCH4887030.1 hypothetical protein [Acidaminobacter sp. JC074]